ncbi:DUF1189 domain-containing protein [Neobacillus dielmonensis]|uniref:DUF1189 domain-containing protein n=1 Tax=Neobacillus dielmonensis TaxID=1347369 RepID=UPI0005A92BFA|nr:DUF1189 domain-containing protein [Neobacillus dielmonensis]
MNLFKQLWKSIYSPKDIASFRSQGIGKTIVFVFLLTFISILPSIYYLSSAFSAGLDKAEVLLQKEAPDFTVEDGQLTADTKVPVIVNKNGITFIIDPTGAVSEEDVADESNAFALLKDRFVMVTGGQTESSPYSMIPGLTLSNEDLLSFVDYLAGLKGVIITILVILVYLISCVISFIEVSIVALIGLLIKNLAGRELNYGQLWRMAAYSETLPTLFFMIMAALKTTVPNSTGLNWLVVLLVLFLAINEVPRAEKNS